MSTQILPRITHVAIKYDGKTYSLPEPKRHHDVIRMIAFVNGEGIKGPDVQGFLDSHGRFLNRREAMRLVTASGQINRREGGYQGPELFSEDLW